MSLSKRLVAVSSGTGVSFLISVPGDADMDMLEQALWERCQVHPAILNAHIASVLETHGIAVERRWQNTGWS